MAGLFRSQVFMMQLNPHAINKAIPFINKWIDSYLAETLNNRIRVTDLGFKNLNNHFSQEILEASYAVKVPEVTTPPLADFGLPEFDLFNQGNTAGITYKNTYFIIDGAWDQEHIHFHELVHVEQWRKYGDLGFIEKYARELLIYGYRDCPLEVEAYGKEAEFVSKIRGSNEL
jgi:hypothetical protein